MSTVLQHLDRALEELSTHADELRDLDAAVGDGDLGITIASGARAARQALTDQPPGTVAELLRTVGGAFARANPSTMGALIGAGLLAGAKEVGNDATAWNSEVAARVGRAAGGRVAERGKAELGDKTVLDALLPSLDALDTATAGNVLSAMEQAAQEGVEVTRDSVGRRGRAAWVGERGAGHPDPGAVAYVLWLRALIATSEH